MANKVKTEVKTEEFVNDVEAGDYQSFGQDEAAVLEAGDNGKEPEEEDMIELDTCGGDEGEKADAAKAAAMTPTAVVPLPKGDAENDEHDLISMPSKNVVVSDLGELNRKKRLIVRTLTADDLLNPILHDVIRSKSCSSVALDFVATADEERSKIGIMTITFTTSKQTTQAHTTLQALREDLDIECVPVSESPNALVEKFKKDNATTNQLIGPMLIVKNLDPATASVEKLSELFPDAEDIVISSLPQASNLGKLKGTKHAYLTYPDEDQANAALQAFNDNPVQIDDRDLIICMYKEPPHHIPEGYLPLTTRKLVLRQIARAKGLMVRCQEDPTYEMAAVWPQRLKRATEMIEKDDAARDLLGLPKPTLIDFKDMTNLKQLNPQQSDNILSRFELADSPQGPSSGGGNTSYRKRPSGGGDSGQNKRQNRGGPNRGNSNNRGGNQPHMGGGGGGRGGRGGSGGGGGRSFGAGFPNRGLMGAPSNAGMMFGMMQPLPRLISPPNVYSPLTPGPGNFPLMSGMRAPPPRGGRGYGRPY